MSRFQKQAFKITEHNIFSGKINKHNMATKIKQNISVFSRNEDSPKMYIHSWKIVLSLNLSNNFRFDREFHNTNKMQSFYYDHPSCQRKLIIITWGIECDFKVSIGHIIIKEIFLPNKVLAKGQL